MTINNKTGFSFFLYLLFILTLFINSCSSNVEQFRQGKKLYETHCESCHMADGTGLGGNIPPLAASDYLKERQDKIACIIRYGLSDSITVNGVLFTEEMLAIPQLSEFEIANIINFINHSWGNDYSFVTVEGLRSDLQGCK